MHEPFISKTGDQKSGPSLRSAPEFQPNVIVEVKSEDPMSHKQLKVRLIYLPGHAVCVSFCESAFLRVALHLLSMGATFLIYAGNLVLGFN